MHVPRTLINTADCINQEGPKSAVTESIMVHYMTLLLITIHYYMAKIVRAL